MPRPIFLGEFEQLVLLTLLKIRDDPVAIRLREEMNAVSGRTVSRGALYRTLDRLENKGYIQWETEEGGAHRSGHVRRRFEVTDEGRAVLRAARQTLLALWDSVEDTL